MHTVVPGAAITASAGVRIGLIIMCRVSTAVSGDAQILLLTILHFTISPLDGVYTKVRPVYTSAPFTYHINAGDEPPFTGMALKVTGLAAMHSIVSGLANINTDGVTTGAGFTTTVTAADVAAQPEGARSSIVYTPGVVVIYVAEVAPGIFTPAFFHWYA